MGARVRDLRRQQKLTQEQLAERAGLSYKFVGEVERGVANPTLDTLERLAGALEIDIVDLLKKAYEVRSFSAADFAAVREARQSLDIVMRRLKRRR